MLSPGRLSALAAVTIVALACWWWPTDERRIRAQLHEMADALNADAGRADFARLAGLATLGGRLAPDIVVEVRGREARGRDAVLSAARAFRATAPGRVVLDEVEVDVQGDAATADVVARLLRDDTSDAATGLAIALTRADGTWLVTRVTERRALRRPAGT